MPCIEGDLRRRTEATPTRRRCCSGSSAGIGAHDPKRRLNLAASSLGAAKSPIGPSYRKGARLRASAPIIARTRGSGPGCAQPNCSTALIALFARAGSATGLAMVCALRSRRTLRFRPNWRCTSTKHPKCARRRSSGGAGRQSEFDCTRPRQRTRFGLAIGTR
jgi:hypothetical protein